MSEYYHKQHKDQEHPNGWYIQRCRVYERIIKNKRRPTPAAILKYGIEFDSQDRVIIPRDLKKPKSIQKVNMEMSAEKSVQWLVENYKVKGMPPKPDSIKKYKQLGAIIELAGGDSKNIIPTLENPEHILKVLQSKYENVETLKQKWQVVLTHVCNVPMELNPDLIHKYQIQFENLKRNSTVEISEKKEEEKVYRWDKILENVENTFGKNSLENFFFRLYDEIPIRSEFSHPIKIVHQSNDAPEDENVLVDTGGHVIQLWLCKWKTKSSKYPDKVIYQFTPELCDIFRRTEQPRHFLLPVKNWAKWVHDTLEKAGFPKFPYGIDDPSLFNLSPGLRRTIASYRNSIFNTSKPKGDELARLMLHDLATSKLVYQHTNFL